jgi:hypothetical protein
MAHSVMEEWEDKLGIQKSECGLRPVGAIGAYAPEGRLKKRRREGAKLGSWEDEKVGKKKLRRWENEKVGKKQD